ncbi:YoeB-YefM toxin-antitoxin system antitoxin YefM [Halomonas binhaiensis]|uniref:Antitoxin n=1 Tax=Halomonas binhaiensis TaxID=2562282 RepID=A0A5C1NH57_9GAMM|nr:YoeB-YefM toxin-antitoxin system antitoxin YefM [Halomonas binhaiensis]QEM81808.1 YoeB-YefM toxin-antitoxin system antitoxin YefM [Halomonas binhaiensis]
MRTITYSKARQNFSAVLDETVNDHAPTLITRQNGEPCVLISLEEYDALEETAYLLRSPNNAERLQQSLKQLREGKGRERELIE